MTREQQRQLKQLKTELPKIEKELIKQYKLKKKDYSLYAINGDLFYDAIIFVSEKDGKCICTIKERLKPLWLDDLLWDLLRMEDNKKEPVSIRVTCAFAVSGVYVYEKDVELKSWSLEELKDVVSGFIEHFSTTVDAGRMDDFVNNLVQPYHGELRKALYYIHEKKYPEALSLVSGKRGIFRNKDIDINEAIEAYCREYM